MWSKIEKPGEKNPTLSACAVAYTQLHFKHLWNHDSKMHPGQALKYSRTTLNATSLTISTFACAELGGGDKIIKVHLTCQVEPLESSGEGF